MYVTLDQFLECLVLSHVECNFGLKNWMLNFVLGQVLKYFN